jgi:hypothetical protein
MNKHEWAARQQEKPKLRPRQEESEQPPEAEDEAERAAGVSKAPAPLAPDS